MDNGVNHILLQMQLVLSTAKMGKGTVLCYKEKKNVNLREKKGMGEQSKVLREESAGRRQNRNY